MNSAESKIFPTAPVGRGPVAGRGRGAPPVRPGEAAAASDVSSVRSPSTFPPGTCRTRRRRSSSCRTSGGTSEDAPAGPDGNPRTDLAFMPPMLDNLIHEKRIPPIVAVLLAPGPGGQRTIEYDTVSDRYTNFVETEVLPRITRDYQVAFTTDPEGRATFGMSSGAAAALTMAWLHPNLYRRVISYSGTFVALQRNATAPNGAWDFHQTVHSELRAQAAADLAARQRERHRRDVTGRADAQLGDRQQPDGRRAEGQRLSVPVRLFRSSGHVDRACSCRRCRKPSSGCGRATSQGRTDTFTDAGWPVA